jgi:hypothetical protein
MLSFYGERYIDFVSDAPILLFANQVGNFDALCEF